MTTKLITGLAMHLHHNTRDEWCFDFAERVAVIKRNKPPVEQPTRLRLFKLYTNLPAELAAAAAEWDAAPRGELESLEIAQAKWEEEVLRFKPQLDALHAAQCPNCPWDDVQRTIFPKKVRPGVWTPRPDVVYL